MGHSCRLCRRCDLALYPLIHAQPKGAMPSLPPSSFTAVPCLFRQALESNPRVAAGVNQAGDAMNKLVAGVSGFAQQAMGQPQPVELRDPQPANTNGAFRTSDNASAAPAGGSDAPTTKNV